jgi:hypothetical protein
MAGSIYQWSKTAADNGSADADVPWPEGMARRQVNDSARSLMGRVAELLADISGTLTAGGTANGLTVTANSGFTTYANGRLIAFIAASDNTGAATLNVNAIGAKAIRRMGTSGDAALAAGAIKAGGVYTVQYNTAANGGSGAWLLVNPTLDAIFSPIAGSSSITTVGTITTGTWNGTAIGVPYGGTGVTSFTSGNVLVGAGTSAVTATKAAPSGDFVGTSDTQTLTNKTLTSPTISGAVYTSYSGAPISGLISGSTTGTLIEGADSAHLVVGIRDNDSADSFAIVSYNGTAGYNKLVARFRRDGTSEIGGALTATSFSGSGASLTALNASNLSSGTVPDARFPATLPAASGVNLTALNASNLASGTVPDARFPATLPAASGANLTALNASNLASGTVPDARFPATLPAASGANLTALNASNLASGTVADARLPSSMANKTFTGTTSFPGGAEISSAGAIISGNTVFSLDVAGTMAFRPNGAASSTSQMTYDTSGNLTAAGNITANSDERLKEDWALLRGDFIEALAAVRVGTYTRKDTGARQVGVGAQSLGKVLPEAVSEGEDGVLSVAYGQAALAACVELARELVALRKAVGK